jgi:inositol phosphorylceramide synthase catalytic subunit
MDKKYPSSSERSVRTLATASKSLLFSKINPTELTKTSLFSVFYFAWFIGLVGLRSEHIVLFGLIIIAYFGTKVSRQFILAFGIFILYWVVYDSLRILPNYKVNPIHISQPYQLEKQLFGINDGGILYTLNEYFAIHHHSIMDILGGLFYLCWVPVPLAFAVYLYFKDKTTFFSFSYCFVFINFIGFILYYLYPAAPPWYVAQYGFEAHFNVSGGVAGLQYFDQLTGTQIFENLYKKNSNVFAAIPSLHSAYPIIVLYYGIQKRLGLINIIFGIICIGIWFTAVYTGHHYVIDVLAGIAVAIFGIWVFERFLDYKVYSFWFYHSAINNNNNT